MASDLDCWWQVPARRRLARCRSCAQKLITVECRAQNRGISRAVMTKERRSWRGCPQVALEDSRHR